jgi:hypothetical protein
MHATWDTQGKGRFASITSHQELRTQASRLLPHCFYQPERLVLQLHIRTTAALHTAVPPPAAAAAAATEHNQQPAQTHLLPQLLLPPPAPWTHGSQVANKHTRNSLGSTFPLQVLLLLLLLS